MEECFLLIKEPGPLFVLNADFVKSVDVTPTFEQVQDAIHAAGKAMVDATRSISQWDDHPKHRRSGLFRA